MAKMEENSVKWKREGAFRYEFVRGVFGEEDEASAKAIGEISEGGRILLVADSGVVKQTEGLGTRIGKYLNKHSMSLATAPVLVTAKNETKAPGTSFQQVLSAAAGAKLTRRDAIVAIGGGTTLDAASFAAAQIDGGKIGVLRYPTAVSAMVDGAFALNAFHSLEWSKDACEVFAPPAHVIIDFEFLKTLQSGVWGGGLGEIVRFAAVSDSALMKKMVGVMKQLQERDLAAAEELISLAVASRVKKGATSFALWCARRLQSLSALAMPHGYATARAACIECAYAVEKGYLSEEAQETICRALADSGALSGLKYSHGIIAQAEKIVEALDSYPCDRTLPGGVGKAVHEEKPDKEAYLKVITEFAEATKEE